MQEGRGGGQNKGSGIPRRRGGDGGKGTMSNAWCVHVVRDEARGKARAVMTVAAWG